jgi:hypothetical protein
MSCSPAEDIAWLSCFRRVSSSLISKKKKKKMGDRSPNKNVDDDDDDGRGWSALLDALKALAETDGEADHTAGGEAESSVHLSDEMSRPIAEHIRKELDAQLQAQMDEEMDKYMQEALDKEMQGYLDQQLGGSMSHSPSASDGDSFWGDEDDNVLYRDELPEQEDTSRTFGDLESLEAHFGGGDGIQLPQSDAMRATMSHEEAHELLREIYPAEKSLG